MFCSGGLDVAAERHDGGGLTSKMIPVSRFKTSQGLTMASRLRERPSSGRRTGGPQFTHRGVYRGAAHDARLGGRPPQREGTAGRRYPKPADSGVEEPLAPAAPVSRTLSWCLPGWGEERVKGLAQLLDLVEDRGAGAAQGGRVAGPGGLGTKQLVVERLPAYAPELNPVEGLWSNLKGKGGELANLTVPTLAEVITQAQLGIQRVGQIPYLAYSFLRRTGLSVSSTS
jgi:hypothetical protein